jgi:hypothetical protein
LISIAIRESQILSGEKPALTQMQMLSILLKWLLILIEEPMIADQMLIMQMFLRDIHDTIRPLSFTEE